jgi:HK97 family phage major capsid protein
MHYERILSEYVSTLWAIEPEKLETINSIIALRVAGGHFSAEEIEARVGGRDSSRAPRKSSGVAILPVYGVISNRMSAMNDMSGGTSVEKLTAQFRDAMNDPSIGTIVLDIDSPGGSVAGLPELADEIFAARSSKRIVAQVNPLAASAAYWLAASASEIAMTPSGQAGSIGVFTTHEDVSKMLEAKGIKVTTIAAGRFKTEGAPHEPLGDEAKSHLQDRVNQYYDMFVGAVGRGRGVSAAAVKSGFGQGRTLSAKDALAGGMVDRIATLDQTLSAIVGQAVSVTSVRAESSAVQVPSAEADGKTASAENKQEVLVMSTQANPAAGAAEVNAVRELALASAEREQMRCTAITTLARTTGMADKAAGWIREGKSIDQVSAEITDTLQRGVTTVRVPTPGAQVSLSEKEHKQYSIMRAMRSMVMAAKRDEKFADADAAFEREISDTIAKKVGRETAGIYVPTNLRAHVAPQFDAVLTGVTAPGANFVQTTIVPTEFIDLLRNKMVLMKLGARKLGDLQGNVQLPKQTAAATLQWTGENPGSAVTASDQTTGNLTLNPKTAMAQTLYSRQFIIQSSIDAEQFVREDLAAINAIGLDLAGLVGTGASNQPTGIANTSGVTVIAIGTNGGAITYNLVIDGQTALENNNIPLVSPGVAATPGIKGKLRKTAKLANTISNAIWEDDNTVAGYAAVSSNQLPANLTKGTGTNLHMMIIGDFAQVIMAEWGALELIADPYTQAGKGNVVITSSMLVDIGVRYATAFSVYKDIDPTL